jgi:hypothetical protein
LFGLNMIQILDKKISLKEVRKGNNMFK